MLSKKVCSADVRTCRFADSCISTHCPRTWMTSGEAFALFALFRWRSGSGGELA